MPRGAATIWTPTPNAPQPTGGRHWGVMVLRPIVARRSRSGMLESVEKRNPPPKAEGFSCVQSDTPREKVPGNYWVPLFT